jgi:hypothetical protein
MQKRPGRQQAKSQYLFYKYHGHLLCMACSNEKHYSIVEESLIYIFQYNGHGQGRATCSSVPITACSSSAELPWPGKEGKLLFFECPNLFNMGSMHDSSENNLCYVRTCRFTLYTWENGLKETSLFHQRTIPC